MNSRSSERPTFQSKAILSFLMKPCYGVTEKSTSIGSMSGINHPSNF
jgi:hypothetical protein